MIAIKQRCIMVQNGWVEAYRHTYWAAPTPATALSLSRSRKERRNITGIACQATSNRFRMGT